jgi:hypothetical protein
MNRLNVHWRDSATGTEHDTEVYVRPGSEDLIPLTVAAGDLSGARDIWRVQVLDITKD